MVISEEVVTSAVAVIDAVDVSHGRDQRVKIYTFLTPSQIVALVGSPSKSTQSKNSVESERRIPYMNHMNDMVHRTIWFSQNQKMHYMRENKHQISTVAIALVKVSYLLYCKTWFMTN